jgi:hypothetical protein
MARRCSAAVATVVLLITSSTTYAQTVGFDRRPEVILSKDGREIRLLKRLTFTDKRGVSWRVPAGYTSDGASIPRVFWSVVGAPLSGRYRDAAIVHDYFCEKRSHPWERVHAMFYEASLAGGVEPSLAWAMYQVVHHLGPRWTALTNIPDDCLTGKAPLSSCVLNAEPPEFPSIDRETVIRIDEGIRAKGHSELAAKIKSELEKLVRKVE